MSLILHVWEIVDFHVFSGSSWNVTEFSMDFKQTHACLVLWYVADIMLFPEYVFINSRIQGIPWNSLHVPDNSEFKGPIIIQGMLNKFLKRIELSRRFLDVIVLWLLLLLQFCCCCCSCIFWISWNSKNYSHFQSLPICRWNFPKIIVPWICLELLTCSGILWNSSEPSGTSKMFS